MIVTVDRRCDGLAPLVGAGHRGTHLAAFVSITQREEPAAPHDGGLSYGRAQPQLQPEVLPQFRHL
jgi:hypothetical protein